MAPSSRFIQCDSGIPEPSLAIAATGGVETEVLELPDRLGRWYGDGLGCLRKRFQIRWLA
jgi:hypothetical protein